MADADQTALEQATAPQAPKHRKLSRNLVPIFMIGFILVVIAVAFIQAGPDLGQGEEDRKRAEALAKMKAKNYEDAVVNPTATAAQAAEDAARKAKAAAAVEPTPGAPLPSGVPLNQNQVSAIELERYETARRALAQGQKPDAARQRGGSDSVDDQKGSATTASFVSRSIRKSSDSNGQDQSSQPAATQVQAAANSSKPDPRAAGRESAAMLMEQQTKLAREALASQGLAAGKGTAVTAAGDGNSAWLYAAQSAEPKENKPLQAQVTLGRYVIFAGTAISAVLTQAVDTKLPGQLSARVTRDIYDSRYGQFLVVPKGSILTGTYRSAITDGQTRVLMAFDRLITPAGGNVPLGNMAASDVLGVGGVPGELHTHFFQRMGIAALLALETAFVEKKVGTVGVVPSSNGTQTSLGGYGSSTSSAAGQILLQTANQELQRQYAVTPHITIEPAAPITIISTADIEIPPIANTR